MIRLFASHPDYDKFAQLQRLIMYAINPCMLYFEDEIDIPELELSILKADLLEQMKILMDNYQFLPANIAGVLNGLEDG